METKFYDITFENCEVMKIPESKVKSFYASGVTETYAGYGGYSSLSGIDKSKDAKYLELSIDKKWLMEVNPRVVMRPGCDSDDNLLERLAYGDIVAIGLPDGTTINVPWDDDGYNSDIQNGTQTVETVNFMGEQDENGEYCGIKFQYAGTDSKDDPLDSEKDTEDNSEEKECAQEDTKKKQEEIEKATNVFNGLYAVSDGLDIAIDDIMDAISKLKKIYIPK